MTEPIAQTQANKVDDTNENSEMLSETVQFDASDETYKDESETKTDHNDPVQDAEYSDNYVKERFYWLKPAIELFGSGLAGTFGILGFMYFIANDVSWVVIATIFLVGIAFLSMTRTIWIWKNWTYEFDPFSNSVTLYKPGKKWLLVREHGSPTIPMQGTAVTSFSQSRLEQYVFPRSFTVTVDNDLQTDEAFHMLSYVKDAKKLRNILVWYNNIVQRREKEEGDINRQLLIESKRTNDLLADLIEAVKNLSGMKTE